MITWFKKKPMFRPYGYRARIGQWRVFPYLVLTEDGKALNVSRHELYNYDNCGKKYPHSSTKQQLREIKRQGIWERKIDHEIYSEDVFLPA